MEFCIENIPGAGDIAGKCGAIFIPDKNYLFMFARITLQLV